jgi:predicted homoserine dehydrogenase-like protein
MNLYAKLREREAQGKPLRVGLVGAGKFGAMYLAQVPKTPGLHLAGIADLAPANAKTNLQRVGWNPERYAAASLDAAFSSGLTHVGDDWQALIAHPLIDIVVEATGNPIAAVEHALAAFRHGKHVVMVTVEADAMCGPLMARRAREAGVVYSLAYGDQPALICDLVDWARAAGFNVVAAGRGHKWLPHFAQSTPETVWGYYGLTPEQAEHNVTALLGLPHVRVLSEQEDFWHVYSEVARGLAVRGNDVPDAHLAALLRQHDVPTLHTNDRDFLKFGFLKVRNPFEEKSR